MIRKRIPQCLFFAAVIGLLLNWPPATAHAQGTAFTYQGLLQNNDVPCGGAFDFKFLLYTNSSGGTAVAGPVLTNGVTINNGAFTVTLDFGAEVWNGRTNWLEILVEGNGDSGFTTLAPRQQMRPTPYAIFAETASNLSGTLPIAQLSGTINNSQLANSSLTVNAGSGLMGGGTVPLGGTTTLGIMAGGVNNSMLASPSITINTGSGLSGGGPVALGGSITLSGSGVTSLTGGDGVTVSGGTGDLTLGLGKTLTLAGLPVTINAGGSLLYADNNYNYFAGIQAGNPATTGSYNTAGGAGALAQNQNGNANTGNGFNALAINTSGSFNAANGSVALEFNTSGSYNTANGANALQNNAVGSYNTAVGYSALSQLGSEPGPGGTNNIAIGNGAGSAFFSNESSNIDIGNAGVAGENFVTRIGDKQTVAYIAGIITGNGSGLTSLNASQITGGTINNSQLANSSITVNTGPGLSAVGSPVALGGTITLNNIGVTSLAGGGGVTVSASSGAVTLGSTATSLNTPNTIVGRDGSGSFAAQNLTLAGILNLPAPPVTINSGANSLLLGDGNRDLFVGLAAGNLTSGAGDNTGLGYESLQAVTSGNENVAVGSYSLAANTTGNENAALGYESLQQNTTGFGNTACGWESLKVNTNGWYDTAIGLWALQLNTSGNNNTAVGYDALGGNTTGNENTAFGVHANLSNTTGSNNVAVGWWSLNYCPGGSGNIAVGYQAGINFGNTESGNIDIGNGGVEGDNNTIRIGSVNNAGSNEVANTYVAGIWAAPVSSGLPVVVDSSGHLGVQAASASYTTGNTADGYQGLYANTSGSQNTADGYQALYLNTSGDDNVAVGAFALEANTNGSVNTACGIGALWNNTSGGYNTAVGASALLKNTTGTFNTAVGVSALDETTTGTGNIAIGYEAGSQLLNGNENNNIDIGNGGVEGESDVTRIGAPGVQTATYLAGICNSKGYGCQQGINGPTYGNSFNFWWTGSQLQAWVDTTDIGVVQVTSDRRLKENIQPMADDALTRVLALRPSSFKYKNIPGTVFQGDGTTEEGFIADELQQVIPSAVNGQTNALTSSGTIQPQTVNLLPVVAVLTKAVQEQQHEITQVAELKSENTELKAQVTDLRSQLDALQKAVARLAIKSPGALAMNAQAQQEK